jgi:3-hydroxybutyryl-CoA dehydratase
MKLKIGDFYKEEFIITQEMVNQFAKLSGDKNPLHINKDFASKTRFKKPIVHGLFSVTSFGKVMGTKFPGSGSIHVSQNLSFKKPLYPDQKYFVCVELIRRIKDKHFGVFKTQILDIKDKIVVDGTGIVCHETKL